MSKKKTYVCKKCGKKYTNKNFYDKHIEKCFVGVKEEEDETIVEKVEDVIEDIVEKVFNKVEKAEKELFSYLELINFQLPGSKTEWKKLYEWHNIIYENNKKIDSACPSCRRHVYQTLISYYKFNKK